MSDEGTELTVLLPDSYHAKLQALCDKFGLTPRSWIMVTLDKQCEDFDIQIVA